MGFTGVDVEEVRGGVEPLASVEHGLITWFIVAKPSAIEAGNGASVAESARGGSTVMNPKVHVEPALLSDDAWRQLPQVVRQSQQSPLVHGCFSFASLTVTESIDTQPVTSRPVPCSWATMQVRLFPSVATTRPGTPFSKTSPPIFGPLISILP